MARDLDRLLLRIQADSTDLRAGMSQAGAIVTEGSRDMERRFDGVRRGLSMVRGQIAGIAAAYFGLRAGARFIGDLYDTALTRNARLAGAAADLTDAWALFKGELADTVAGPMADALEWAVDFVRELRAGAEAWQGLIADLAETPSPENLRERRAELAEAEADLASARDNPRYRNAPSIIVQLEQDVARLQAEVAALEADPRSAIEPGDLAPVPFPKPDAPKGGGGATRRARRPDQAVPDFAEMMQARAGAIRETGAEMKEALEQARADTARLLDDITDDWLRATGQQEAILERSLDAQLDELEARRTEEARRAAEEIATANREAAEAIERAFSGTFGEIRQQSQDLDFDLKALARALIGDLTAQFRSLGLGSFSDGTGLFGLFKGLIPGLAKGGPIDGPAIVGERGPELFVPRVPGTIVPHDRLNAGGGGVTVNQTFNVAPGVGVETMVMMRQEAARARREAVSDMIVLQRRSFGALV